MATSYCNKVYMFISISNNTIFGSVESEGYMKKNDQKTKTSRGALLAESGLKEDYKAETFVRNNQ